MAQALGAATTGMANFYGHLHSRDAMSNPLLWPRPQTDDLAAAGIVVDAQGRRVADEGLGGIYLSNAIARLADPLGTTAIFDQAIWDGPPGRGHVQPPNPLLPEVGGTLHRADTIAELAALIGMPHAEGDGRPIQRRDRRRHARDNSRRRGADRRRPGRSGPRRSTPCRSAPRSPTPWAASS